MAQALDVTVLHLHIEMREDGVGRVGLVGTEKTLAAQSVHMLPMLCAALRQQQIVVAVFLVDVRPFRVPAAKSSSQVVYLPKLFSRLHINLTDFDVAFFP